jgi:hypothetical protein
VNDMSVSCPSSPESIGDRAKIGGAKIGGVVSVFKHCVVNCLFAQVRTLTIRWGEGLVL